MTYSNEMPLSYYNTVPQNQNIQAAQNKPLSYYGEYPVRNNQNLPVKKSSLSAGLSGAGIGILAGGVFGAVQKNPYMKNGIPTDEFAQLAYKRYLKKAPSTEQQAYGQTNEVINNIHKMKTTDELKTLLNSNPEASKEIATALNKSTDEYLSSITDSNISANKDVIKKKLEAANLTRYQDMKNEISRAWCAEKKKFVRPDDMEKTTFRAIKRTSDIIRSKVVARYALVVGAITGALTFILHKLTHHDKHRNQDKF